MNVKSTIMVIITAVLAVLMTVSVLVPVTQSAQSSIMTTYDNVGVPVEDISEGSWESTLTFDAGAASLSVGGSPISITDQTAVVFMSDMATCIYNMSTVLVYGYDPVTSATYRIPNPSSTVITVDGGTVSIVCTTSSGDVTYSHSCAWAFGYSAEGAYKSQYQNGTTIYVKDANEIYGAFQTNSSPAKFYSLHGDAVNVAGEEVTATINLRATSVEGLNYMELSRSTSSDYTFQYNGSTEWPIAIVVPASISEYTHSENAPVMALVNIVPLMMLVGVVIAVIRSRLE